MNILNTTQVPRDFSKYSLSREDYALYKNVQNILKQKNVQKEFINDFAENVVYLHKIYPQVDMKALYEKINRLNRLEEISHNPKDSFAARYFCTYLDKMGNDIGSVIEFKIQQNETTYMHNLDHEEVHLFATRLGPDKKPVDIGMGLTYTHEIWTEYTANRIAEIKSDLHMSDRNLLNRYRVKEVPSSKNIYEIALNESGNVAKFKVDSFGYMALLPYMNVLDKMYHEQFYSDNLNGTNILIDNKTDLFLNLEGCLETLYKIPSINAMKDTSDALSLIYIDYLHTNAKNLSTEEYFELQKSFLESNPSVNNRNLGFEAIQEGDIIFALSKLEGDFDLKREINPETRSFEVNAFLASLEYQKDSGDILNSKYAIKVSEGSLNIFFKQDEFIYKVKFENGKIVDNIELLEEPKDLAWTNFSQIPLFEVKKYNSFLKPIEHINSYGVIENVKFEELLNMSYSNKLELFQGNSLNQRVFKCLAFNNSKDIDLDEILIVMDDNSKDKDNRNLSYVLAMGSLSKNASSTLCDTIAKDVQNFDKIFFNKDNFGKDSFDYSLENSKDIVSSSIIKSFMVSDSNAELEKHLIDFNEFLIQHKESIKSNPDNFFAAMQLAVNSTYEDFTKKGYSEEYKNYVFSTFMNEANQSISFNEIKNSKGQNFLNYLESSLYTTNLYLEYSNCIKDDSFRKILLNNNFSPFEIDSYNETAYKHFLTNLKSQFINEDVLVNREFQKKLYEFVDAIPGTPPRNIIKILGKENIGYNVACDLAYKGLNVNDFCQEDSLVKIAVDRGDKNILGFLSHHDINLSKMVPSAGKTMLEYMNDKISLNTSKSASIRESMRAILNTENSAGSTGLYTVLMKPEVPADKKVELLDIARNLGGDFSKKDSSGLSLMDYTSDTKVILKLAECGVDARDYNNQDCTLNRLIRNCNVEALSRLVQIDSSYSQSIIENPEFSKLDSKLQTEILSSEEMISNSLQENNIFLLKSIIYHNPEAIETIASNSNFNLLDNGEKSDLIDYSISVATTNGSSFEDKKEIFAELIKQNPENLNLILNNNHFQQVHDTVKADLLSNEECISAIIESDRLELLKYQVSQDSSILETLATNDAYTSLDYEVQKELCSSREFIDAFIEERDLISLTNLIETDVSISDRIFSSEKLESLEPSEIEALAKCSEVAYTAQSESLEDFSADIERTEVKDVVADIESKNSIELD